ncbi:MAG: nucleoside kinase [Lachnospiraceae bacterium]|nr:nucleoside kinase [Lachnospiraceae bacterium]
MVKVTIGGKEKEYPTGISYEAIANEYQGEYEDLIALVFVNGKMTELQKTLKKSCEIGFITLHESAGHKTYVRTATLLLLKAVSDILGVKEAAKIKVEFSIGKGYYCSSGEAEITPKLAEQVNDRMKELVKSNLPIRKETYPIEYATRLFKDRGMTDKENLFRYRRSSTVNVYELDGYFDYFYGHMLPSTGYVKYFQVSYYENGLMLNLPERHEPKLVEEFKPRQKLFETLKQAGDWGRKLGIDTVGDLNNQICAGNLSELVLVQEAQQERRIGEIAEEIAARSGVKFVMIAGPSSSGKTTFSHRLSIQLRTYGLTPHPIAVDDYFVDRDKTPKDENGDYNFECLEAIDLEQFNQDMCALLEGKEVELPTFNFKTGKREYKGNRKSLGEDDILVIEGIHGLNDRMSHSLPNSSKFKIYISALTSLNIDEHNRIPTTDGRLIRRMVRDARTRGTAAKRTIQMWSSVRRGEEENIFPFQESADAFFNSALIYELAVLKQFAEPLLFQISKGEPEYYEAKRLLKFLDYFLGVSSENLPNNSIVREFVGGSCFNV